MQLKIKTDKLQEMVSRAIKGAGFNKLIPLTSLIAIECKDGELQFTTTDATNYLYIKESGVGGDDFYAVVEAGKFSKLISKMTCEFITLELNQNLEVHGNGNYTIELPLDEDGNPIKFPNPLENVQLKMEPDTVIQKSTIEVILNSLKPSLATTLEVPCYVGYHIADKVTATDTFKIASLDVKLFNEARLISPEMMNLLDVIGAENINVDMTDSEIIFSTPDCIVYGRKMEGIEDYQIDAINGLVAQEFPSKCKLPKKALLQLLDRLSLFVGTYDKNSIKLTFIPEGIQISSKSSNGVEIVSYLDSTDFKAFTCLVDVEMLTQQIKACTEDSIELHYGLENCVKFRDGKITQVLALMQDTE